MGDGKFMSTKQGMGGSVGRVSRITRTKAIGRDVVEVSGVETDARVDTSSSSGVLWGDGDVWMWHQLGLAASGM
jgi:hypothetical protein